jgi:hypothetical protein
MLRQAFLNKMHEEPTLYQSINRYAIISLISAILALLSFCIGAAPLPLTALVCYPVSIILGIAALWAGLVSIRQIRASHENGQSLAKIGIWVGSFTILFVMCAIALVVVLWPYFYEFIQGVWNQVTNSVDHDFD